MKFARKSSTFKSGFNQTYTVQSCSRDIFHSRIKRGTLLILSFGHISYFIFIPVRNYNPASKLNIPREFMWRGLPTVAPDLHGKPNKGNCASGRKYSQTKQRLLIFFSQSETVSWNFPMFVYPGHFVVC